MSFSFPLIIFSISVQFSSVSFIIWMDMYIFACIAASLWRTSISDAKQLSFLTWYSISCVTFRMFFEMQRGLETGSACLGFLLVKSLAVCEPPLLLCLEWSSGSTKKCVSGSQREHERRVLDPAWPIGRSGRQEESSRDPVILARAPVPWPTFSIAPLHWRSLWLNYI